MATVGNVIIRVEVFRKYHVGNAKPGPSIVAVIAFGCLDDMI